MEQRWGYRPELDGLRGVAIAFVLALHWWPTLAPGGRIGVDLFFVLSGFLITTLMIEAGPRFSMARFYERRARRLLPALAVLLVVFWWADGAGWVALYVGNWARAAGELSPYLAHTWSLAIEEQFYLMWPLVFLGLRRFPRPLVAVLLAGFAVGVGAYRVGLDAPWERLVNGTDTRLDGLALGCAVAFGWPWLRRIRWQVGAAVAFPAMLAVAVVNTNTLGWGSTVVSAAWALVLCAVLTGTGRAALSTRPMVLAGKLSYSLYLWHVPITVWLRDGDMLHTTAVTTVVAVVASLVAAVASYRFVEQPFRSGLRFHHDRASIERPGSAGHGVLAGEGR